MREDVAYAHSILVEISVSANEVLEAFNNTIGPIDPTLLRYLTDAVIALNRISRVVDAMAVVEPVE